MNPSTASLYSRAPDRLIRALQEARADDTGVVLTAAGPEDLARLVAHVGRGTAPAPRTRGDRVRLLARLAGETA